MTRRELVKAAIGHREAERVPCLIDITPEAWEKLAPLATGRTREEFLDNDVQDIGAVWWNWGELAEDWKGWDEPRSRAHVAGVDGNTEYADSIKRARETTDKYLLVRI